MLWRSILQNFIIRNNCSWFDSSQTDTADSRVYEVEPLIIYSQSGGEFRFLAVIIAVLAIEKIQHHIKAWDMAVFRPLAHSSRLAACQKGMYPKLLFHSWGSNVGYEY